jgi:DNA-binding NarL/FixJ family response regulator
MKFRNSDYGLGGNVMLADQKRDGGKVTWTYCSVAPSVVPMQESGRKVFTTEDIPQPPNNTSDLDEGASSTIRVDHSASAARTIVVIEKRALVRECLTHSIRAAGHNVLSFSSVESWLKAPDDGLASLVVLCTGSSPNDAGECGELLMQLCQSSRQVPSILLSDAEDPDRIVDALDQGARGYIPTSVSLDVAIEAMRLVRAGGVFVPANSFVAARRSTERPVSRQIGNTRLTARQAAVVEALRRGKANKVIAYELNMRESTVKVHVRNIMKKFNARNRTEVAFKANAQQDPSRS